MKAFIERCRASAARKPWFTLFVIQALIIAGMGWRR